MKIRITIVLFLAWGTFSAVAQQHYQLMSMAVNNFLENRNQDFKQIPVVWNMEGEIQADLNNGINYLLEGHPALAKGSFDVVLKKDHTLWPAYYYRAIAHRKQTNYHQALFDLQAALKLYPKLYEAHLEIATCFLMLKSLEEGKSAIKKAIQLDKSRAEAYYITGCINELQQQAEPALKSFRQCLEADSLFHNARISIALVALFQNKDEASAINELNSVLALDSLQKDALLIRSILTFEKNKQASLHDLTSLISASPTNIMAYYLRGMIYTTLQRYDRGFSDFQKVIRSTSTDENNFQGQQTWVDKKIDIQNVGAYTLTRLYGLRDDDAAKLMQAYCLIMTNAFDKSIAAINSTSDPEREPLAVYLKAVAFEHQGKHKMAFIAYNDAIELDNTIADAYKKRGIYEQELKQWESSIDDFTTVLRLLPEAFVMYKIRGVSHYHNEAFDKAIADFTKYLERDPTNQQVLGYRGMAYEKNHQKLYGYIDFANSQNYQALDFKEMMELIKSVLQKGDTTLALTALGSFVRANPSLAEGYALKLRLHHLQNDWTSIEQCVFDALANLPSTAPKKDRGYLITLKGIVMTRSDRHDEALQAFDEAIRHDKANALAYLERGKILLTRNKTKATDDLRKSASLGNKEAGNLLKSI